MLVFFSGIFTLLRKVYEFTKNHFRTFQKAMWLLSCMRFCVPVCTSYCFGFMCSRFGVVQSKTEAWFGLREETLEQRWVWWRGVSCITLWDQISMAWFRVCAQYEFAFSLLFNTGNMLYRMPRLLTLFSESFYYKPRTEGSSWVRFSFSLIMLECCRSNNRKQIHQGVKLFFTHLTVEKY